MNSSEVAKLLGVSVSTIQRWVKQLELPMERNERGHYCFKQEDINQLKMIHEQLQNGVLLQELVPVKEEKTVRKGTVKSVERNESLENLADKVKELELKLHAKADSVTSYQLLQHRREIEELQSQVKELTKITATLQEQIDDMKQSSQKDKLHVLEKGHIKRKKKNFVSSLFGF